LRYVFRSITLRYGFRSHGGIAMTPPRTQPRIAPLAPPYPPAIDAALGAMMPRNSPVEPLRLFRTFVHHPRMAEAMTALGRFVLGRELALDLHDRELVIDRVCARCACEYEWGVHVASFGVRAGLTPEQLDATATGGADSPVWTERDALLVRLVDELHDTATVSDALWSELARRWSAPQLLELLLVAGWYHAIAYLANGARVEPEEWAARFPAPPVA
jgi:4-carboxymuconolactone decarboxylase